MNGPWSWHAFIRSAFLQDGRIVHLSTPAHREHCAQNSIPRICITDSGDFFIHFIFGKKVSEKGVRLEFHQFMQEKPQNVSRSELG